MPCRQRARAQTDSPATRDEIEYRLNPPLTNAELNALFSSGWPSWQTEPDTSDWQPELARSLAYLAAMAPAERLRGVSRPFSGVSGQSPGFSHEDAASFLVGFVNVAWDGRDHAFLLDSRVHPAYRGRGIGTALVRRASVASAAAGCQWLHVDYMPEMARFYTACGFQPTSAGLIRLDEKSGGAGSGR